MRKKIESTILTVLFVATAAVTTPVFAEEVVPPVEIVKKTDVKKTEAKKTDAKKKPATTEKTTAVKKAKTSSNAKSTNSTETPVEKKPAPAPTPTTPVAGGGAFSPTGAVKKIDAETSSVTVAPLPYVTRKVSALIESSPSGCDIEVDGVYVGATPVELHLKEGVHFMRISRGGYLPWEKTVKAYNGLFVYATLTQESSRKIEVNESVKAK